MRLHPEIEFRSYLRTLLWSTTDDEGESLDGRYDEDDLTPAVLAELRAEFDDFLSIIAEDDAETWISELGDRQIGHDFALTRNHHGAGFWDRFYGDTEAAAAGDRLTALAQTFGDVDLYVGDDGNLYV